MKAYISYFKSELLVGLQYKEAAIAGLATQFFWGLLFAFVYRAFYNYTNIDSISLSELMCYVWLNQAFFSLIILSVRDNRIMEEIKNGSVAYELARPYNLYWWWYLKHLSRKYAACFLRFFPVIVFAFLLPKPYSLTLPYSTLSFIMFIISLFLGTLIVASIAMIIQIVSFFTYNDKGIASIIYTVGHLLSGFDIPLPLMPVLFLKMTEYLPFRLISDLSLRLYSGNIDFNYGFKSIIFQIIWIVVLVVIGKIMMKNALNKVAIQGG